MSIQGKKELFDENGSIAVWGKVSSSGRPFYTFQLTSEDKYILFPMISENPKAPKFILKKVDSTKTNTVKDKEEIPF